MSSPPTPRVAGDDIGKGCLRCLRLKPSAPVDADLVRALLEATAASPEAPC